MYRIYLYIFKYFSFEWNDLQLFVVLFVVALNSAQTLGGNKLAVGLIYVSTTYLI